MGATAVPLSTVSRGYHALHGLLLRNVQYDVCVRRLLWRFFNQRSTLVFYLVRLAVSWTHGRCLDRALIVAKCRRTATYT